MRTTRPLRLSLALASTACLVACGDAGGSSSAATVPTTTTETVTGAPDVTSGAPTSGPLPMTGTTGDTTDTTGGVGTGTSHPNTSEGPGTSTAAATDAITGDETTSASTSGPDTSTTGPGDTTTGSTGSSTTEPDGTDTNNPDAPGPITELAVDPTNAANYLSWSWPLDPDYAGVLVLRRAGAPVTAFPADGATYLAGEVLGDSEVIFAAGGTNLLDSPLTNGTTYHYRVFAHDDAANYAIGVAGSGTPYDPHPANYAGYTALSLVDEIGHYDLVLDDADRLHLALSIGKPGNKFAHYARCTAECDGPEDWTLTKVGTAPMDGNAGPRIALDAQGRPRIVYRESVGAGMFLTCDQGCDTAGNWTQVQVFDAISDNALAIDESGVTWFFAAGKPTRFARCADGCSNANGWSAASLAVDSAFLHEGAYASDRVALPLSRWNGGDYTLHVLSCGGACDDPATWDNYLVGSTQGNTGTAPYRVDAWGGGHMISSHLRRFYTCKDCAPELPQHIYDFDLQQIFSEGRLELSAAGHPRIVATEQSGKFHYMTCDFNCAVKSQWIESPMLEASWLVRFRLASDEMPVVTYTPYADPKKLLVRRGLDG